MQSIPKTKFSRIQAASLAAAALAGSAYAQAPAGEPPTLAPVTVEGSRTSQLGIADSANAGVVTQQQLEARTVYRPGEVLEATPGLIVSQHSGEGKANQFYLRGFNLDHGTDLRTTVDGMLVNQRSHAHGQGWTDLNFLIPELATQLDYKKGPYYASEGDFASAGAVSVRYADKLDRGIASLGIGQRGYRRAFLADSPKVGDGHLLYALEVFKNDGPFVNPDDYRKFNGVLRYSQGNEANGFNVTAMGYSAKWNATDQIPRRAVDSGALSRFGAIDATDGGKASRYSLSGEWRSSTAGGGATKVNAYVVQQQLDLYSNFTYFLDDPVNGDQFNQPDRRVTTGLKAAHTVQTKGLGQASQTTFGLQLENDNIHNALHNTVARQRLSTTRQDHIVESSLGLFVENTTYWNDWFRTVAGLRADTYRFKVDGDNPLNSGKANDSIASPKLGLIFGPWAKTEYYVNAGTGFHSNDARGTTIAFDPKTGDPADRVSPLVRSKGGEVGVRTEIVRGLQSSLALYRLDFDSELVFAGDAGTTFAGRPSRRTGFEFSNYYKPFDWLTVDADVSFARARFKDFDATGSRIPGAVEGVASIALAVDNVGPFFGALQLRYFGPRPLLEDNSVRSKSTATLNGRIGYKINKSARVELEGFNLTNRRDSAIDYYYESRLKDEAVAVNDIHFHPIEPRSFRVTLTMNY
ncbi:MAG: TonB-dependent receptor [Variovorax sp.]